MSKERIAVDVDEVLFPYLEEFLKHDNQLYGGGYVPSDFGSYAFETVLGTTLEEAYSRVRSFNHADHAAIPPLDQAQQAIQRIAKTHDLTIVTARHPDFKVATSKWVQEFFGDVFSDMHHIGYAPVMDKPVQKVDICKQIGAVVLIDDSLTNVKQCAEQGIDGILFGDYTWNQAQALPQGVTRCVDWAEVERHLDERR